MINPLCYPGITTALIPVMKSATLNLSSIELVVCQVFGTTPETLQNSTKCRRRELAKARQLFHYLARQYTNKSLYYVGAYYNKSHATVLNSCKNIEEIIETKDKDFHPLVIQAKNLLIEIINENKHTTSNQVPAVAELAEAVERAVPEPVEGKPVKKRTPVQTFYRNRNPRPCKPVLSPASRRIIPPPCFRKHHTIQPTN